MYFATVFLVFSFSKNKFNPNRPHISFYYHSKFQMNLTFTLSASALTSTHSYDFSHPHFTTPLISITCSIHNTGSGFHHYFVTVFMVVVSISWWAQDFYISFLNKSMDMSLAWLLFYNDYALGFGNVFFLIFYLIVDIYSIQIFFSVGK